MSQEISPPPDIVAFAEEMVSAGPGGLEIIKIHEFPDDEAAHDEELQERKHREFETLYTSLVEELSKRFGPAKIAETEDEFALIPLSGVGSAALWKTKTAELYLAVSHEDRETPILLAIGTA